MVDMHIKPNSHIIFTDMHILSMMKNCSRKQVAMSFYSSKGFETKFRVSSQGKIVQQNSCLYFIFTSPY
jgi:hypothetical protein